MVERTSFAFDRGEKLHRLPHDYMLMTYLTISFLSPVGRSYLEDTSPLNSSEKWQGKGTK